MGAESDRREKVRTLFSVCSEKLRKVPKSTPRAGLHATEVRVFVLVMVLVS